MIYNDKVIVQTFYWSFIINFQKIINKKRMSKVLNYNPEQVKKMLINKPWQGFQQHYLMSSMKKQIEKIRSLYDYQAGSDFIEMLEYRQGVVNQYPQQLSKFYPIINYTIIEQPKQQCQPISPLLQKIYWIFIIEGEITYDEEIYKSGMSVFINNQLLIKDRRYQSKNAMLAVFMKENLDKIVKLMFLRQRKQHINFLLQNVFQPLNSKQLMLLHHQILIIKPFNNQDISKVMTELKQSLPQINYSFRHKNKNQANSVVVGSNKIQQAISIVNQQQSIKKELDNHQNQHELQKQIFQVKQEIGQNSKLIKKEIDHLFMIYKGEIKVLGYKNTLREQMAEVSVLTPGSVFASFKTYKYLKSLLNEDNQDDDKQEDVEYKFICVSVNATIFAIPAFRFQEFPLNLQISIVGKILQTLSSRLKRTRNLLKFRSQTFKKIYHSKNYRHFHKKKFANLSATTLVNPQVFINSQKQYQNTLQSPKKYFSSKNLTCETFNSKISRSKTLYIETGRNTYYSNKDLKSQRKAMKSKQQKEKSLALTSPYGQFFIPQQFVSKKLKIQFEGVLDRMRKKNLQLSFRDQLKSKNDRNYIEEYINQHRIVKKGPKQKFLPITPNQNRVEMFKRWKYHGKSLYNKMNQI